MTGTDPRASAGGRGGLLPGALGTRFGRAVSGLWFALYLVPIVAGVSLDVARAYWLGSGVALAVAVLWLCERGGGPRAAGLLVMVLSAFGNVLLLASLYIQGAGFNAQFFHHLDWVTLGLAWRGFRPLAAVGVVVFT